MAIRYLSLMLAVLAMVGALHIPGAVASDSTDDWALIETELAARTSEWTTDEPRAMAQFAFGEDDRIEVISGTAEGIRTVTALMIDFEGDDFGLCSGTFLSGNLVLTAAHCLHTEDGLDAAAVRLYPGASGGLAPFGGKDGTKFLVPEGWIARPTVGSEFDFGLVLLDGAGFGDQLGPYRSLGILSDGYVSGLTNVEVVGFAGDKPPYTMWRSDAEKAVFTATAIGSHIDGYQGLSGAGLLIPREGTAPLIAGIVSGAPLTDQPDDSPLQTVFVRITQRTVDAMNTYCTAQKCKFGHIQAASPFPVRGLIPLASSDR